MRGSHSSRIAIEIIDCDSVDGILINIFYPEHDFDFIPGAQIQYMPVDAL